MFVHQLLNILLNNNTGVLSVRLSGRYPTKEWKSLGTFHARDERSVQTFPVLDTGMLSKYLRVDMLSHFGTEHYCPLTVLRSLRLYRGPVL